MHLEWIVHTEINQRDSEARLYAPPALAAVAQLSPATTG